MVNFMATRPNGPQRPGSRTQLPFGNPGRAGIRRSGTFPGFNQQDGRLRWRWIICTLVAAYILYCFATSQPLFAHDLPEYTGKYPVGTIDVEALVAQPRLIHDARLRKNGEPAFNLETVLFSLYYPATDAPSRRQLHDWVPKPVSVTAQGYARLAHISNFVTDALLTGALRALVGGVKIPAKVDVPLASIHPQRGSGAFQSSDFTDNEVPLVADEEPHGNAGGLPVIIFTHGMASSRTDYTHYCGELASRGYVVAAIEHRDGSAPGSMVMQKNQATQIIKHFGLADVVLDGEDKTMTKDDFKKTQLAFRQAEIEETVRVLRKINIGQGQSVYKSNPRGEGADLAQWKGRLDTQEMVMAGHSYGATGTLQALKPSPDSQRTLPFKGAVALDPGKGSGPLNSDIAVPVLIIHSNTWSKSRSVFYGRPHFSVVKDIALGLLEKGIEAWFMTSLGTSHPSVTDAPLLMPLLLSWTTGAKIDVKEGVREYVVATADFMRFLGDGERSGLLLEKAEFPEYDKGSGWEKEGQGWRHYWQIHVAPPLDSDASHRV
jgi:platelet-activating factor acetylhydrolase